MALVFIPNTVMEELILSPIADLMKSDVFALGAYLKIPNSILEASPSDGLFGDDKTDEEQLGASYDELEWAMLELTKKKNLMTILPKDKK